MKCPVCPDATLMMSERQGIEIDYCPTCRGVWLDRGELDKLIQLSVTQQPQTQTQTQTQTEPPRKHSDDDYHRQKQYKDYDKYHHHGGYRKKSWLHELFD